MAARRPHRRSAAVVRLSILAAAVAWATPVRAADPAPAAPAAAANVQPYEATINADRTLIYSGPSDRFYKTCRLNAGTKVTVYGTAGAAGDYYKIDPPDGSFSWVAKAYVTPAADGKTGRVAIDQAQVIAGSILNGYKTTGQCKLDKGDSVAILGEEGNYYKITPPANTRLFVLRSAVDPVAGPAAAPPPAGNLVITPAIPAVGPAAVQPTAPPAVATAMPPATPPAAPAAVITPAVLTPVQPVPPTPLVQAPVPPITPPVAVAPLTPTASPAATIVPAVSQPIPATPVASAPVTPVAVTPVAVTPVAVAPAPIAPVAVAPVAVAPVAVAPVAVAPVAVAPVAVAPVAVAPVAIEPAPLDPTPTQVVTAPVTRPAVPPVAAAPARPLPDRYASAESAFMAASRQPIDQQPLAKLTTQYKALSADPALTGGMKQVVDARLSTLSLRTTTRDDYLEVKAAHDAAQGRRQSMHAEQDEMAQRASDQQVTTYTAVGTLRVSSLQQAGGSTLYRLADPTTGRTLVYLRSSDAKYADLLNQFVGVRGDVTEDAGLKYVAPTGVEAVDPSKVNSTVTAKITPPSLAAKATASAAN